MSFKKKLISFYSQLTGYKIEDSFPLNYCIPIYHTVSDHHLPHLKHIINYKSVKHFIQDLEELQKNFQFVNWSEFKDFHNGNYKPKKKVALLTFDDGLREFNDIIAPILEKKGIYAINFINPHFIDNQNLMYRCKASLIIENLHQSEASRKKIASVLKTIDYSLSNLTKKIGKINYTNQKSLDDLAENLEINFKDFLHLQRPYLTSVQLENLKNKGFGISAHSWDHPRYLELTLKRQLETTYKSLDYMKEKEFIDDCFAFPFTDFGITNQFFNELFEKKNLFCSFGASGIKIDSFEKNLHRIPMETGESANHILKNEINGFEFKKLLNKNKIHRQ